MNRKRQAGVRSALGGILLGVGVLGLGAVGGCSDPQKGEPGVVARTEPAPTYAEVAAKYNERVQHLGKFGARAVVRLKYVDEKGETHNEQGEGLLQVVRPDRMALSIKKAGKMLFWFGGDPTRYWLFDVIDDPVVRVGRHDAARRRGASAGLGLDINPREMIRLLGITPLPTAGAEGAAAGTTAWSKDGRLVEVTTPIPTGGTQVISVDPTTMLPQKIALMDASGKAVVTAALELFEPVELVGVGGGRPRNASRVTAVHAASKTEIKLDLNDMRNEIASEKAFDFEELKRALGVERVIDLDAR